MVPIHRAYCDITKDLHLLPSFVIIGVAKSGSSSIYDYLIRHDQISPCVVKEPDYFAKYFNRGVNWYKSCFPLKFQKNNVISGEASIHTYWHPHSPMRVKKILPNAKLIILLRNPIDRAYSHYQMEVNNGVEELSFEEAIENEESRTKNEYQKMIDNENYFSEIFNAKAFTTQGIYINYLKNWFDLFPKNQFLFIKSENFFKHPEDETNRILSFLKLPKIKLPEYHIIRKGVYKQSMNSSTREKLKEFFSPYNEELYKKTGINFGWEE